MNPRTAFRIRDLLFDKSMNGLPRFVRQLGPAAILVVATFLAYLPALRGAFIWNDNDYVTAPALRSLAGLGRIWVDLGATEQYYPLLHSAFWVQDRAFGDHPLGYHLVALALHLLSALLYAAVLRRLFSPSAPASPAAVAQPAFSGELAAWIAAFLFALHPVHVESVAWIAEQKNTLSLAFYLGAALAYLRFDQTQTRGLCLGFRSFRSLTGLQDGHRDPARRPARRFLVEARPPGLEA